MNILTKECITHSTDVNGIIKIEGILTTLLFNFIIVKREKITRLDLCKKDLEFICFRDGISIEQVIINMIEERLEGFRFVGM